MGAATKLLVACAAFAFVGCGSVAGERPPLGISNNTTLVVTLTVNGQPVAEVAPGGPTTEIDESRLPPLPWTVEARTVSGRVLVSMQVEPGSVTSTTNADGSTSSMSVADRADLSCGRLDIWAGFHALGPPPRPDAGEPGDCVP